MLLGALLFAAIIQPVFGEDAEMNDMQNTPLAPRVIYPYGKLDRLTTNIAWFGDVHEACEVRIGLSSEVEQADVWQSGEIVTHETFVTTPVLKSNSRLYTFVRLRNANGWGPWSEGVEFSTPSAPVVLINEPANAGRIQGPRVSIKWTVESDKPIESQSISVDGGSFSDLPIGARDYNTGKLSEGVHEVVFRVKSDGNSSETRATFYVYVPVQLSTQKLYILDLKHLQKVNVDDSGAAADAFDTLHIVSVLQGVVNRDRPQLYIDYTAVDQFWLEKMREDGGYLQHSQLTQLKSVEDSIVILGKHINGAVIWDPEVPATNNVASTVCGVENLIPVRYDETPGSMYDRLIKKGPKLRVVHNLVGMFTGTGIIPGTDRPSTGSSKCDAYLWAKIHYLDSGKCNPQEIGYWCDAFWLQAPKDMSLDNVGLTNHDFVVARRGFICDLNVWPDETPRDDRNQRVGLDRETLQEILLSCHQQSGGKMIHFSGFTPWAIKYTSVGNAGGTHDAVPTEWETAALASTYNAYMDADAIGYVAMANASVFQHSKMPDRYVQNPPPTYEDLLARGYIDRDGKVAPLNFVYHYLGDYDSAAWVYNRMPIIWNNEIRGEIPAGWAINPNLCERIPVAFDWFYKSKTLLDYFIAGDSGAGYINPTLLLPPRNPSALPSGARAWIDHNLKYYRQFNYSITGFLINGFAGRLTPESNRMYEPFSGDGIMTQRHWMPDGNHDSHMQGTMPVADMKQDISAPVEVVIDAILKHGRPGETAFLSFRSILVGPEWIKQVNDGIRSKRPDCRFEPIDPYTYFYLLRHSLGGQNVCRATYTFDTLPAEVRAGEKIRVKIGIRNDGWDTWQTRGQRVVKLTAGFTGRDGVKIGLPHSVDPGGGVVLDVELTAPGTTGKSVLHIDLIRGESDYFEDAGDMPWEKIVLVK